MILLAVQARKSIRVYLLSIKPSSAKAKSMTSQPSMKPLSLQTQSFYSGKPEESLETRRSYRKVDRSRNAPIRWSGFSTGSMTRLDSRCRCQGSQTLTRSLILQWKSPTKSSKRRSQLPSRYRIPRTLQWISAKVAQR